MDNNKRLNMLVVALAVLSNLHKEDLRSDTESGVEIAFEDLWDEALLYTDNLTLYNMVNKES